MFIVEIELLTERWVATEYNDRGSAEWPPHPVRLFSALVAEHTAAQDDTPDAGNIDAEAAALDWLADQPAPVILASPESDVARRTVATHFVPVNDATAVKQPDNQRDKLEEALRSLAEAGNDKDRAKAQKAIEKARAELAKATANYVRPADDTTAAIAKAAATVLPELRGKQPRTFPSLTPGVPRIAFVWPDAPPDALLAPLEALLKRLVRLGHSSSLVYARVARPDAIERLLGQGVQRYVPDPNTGTQMIRVPGPAQRERLIAAYHEHLGNEPRVLPARFVQYAVAGQQVERSVGTTIFSPVLTVLARVGGPRPLLVHAPIVIDVFRRALIAAAPEPKPSFLTGHKPDGSPAEGPRVALFPMAFVGSGYADGSVLGIGLAIPREADPDDARALGLALRTLRRAPAPDGEEGPILLPLGEPGVLELVAANWGQTSRTLEPATWTLASERWVTATPMALDRNPGDLHDKDVIRRNRAFEEAEQIARTAIERVLTPGSAQIETLHVSRSVLLPGATKPREYGAWPSGGGKTPRVLVHVAVTFDRPVCGPLLAGAGRYQGMGLFVPVQQYSAHGGQR